MPPKTPKDSETLQRMAFLLKASVALAEDSPGLSFECARDFHLISEKKVIRKFGHHFHFRERCVKKVFCRKCSGVLTATRSALQSCDFCFILRTFGQEILCEKMSLLRISQ